MTYWDWMIVCNLTFSVLAMLSNVRMDLVAVQLLLLGLSLWQKRGEAAK